MKRFIFIIFLFIILISPCYAQDINVNGRSANLFFDSPNPAGSIAWSALASRNYIIAPTNPDAGFCISVVNNNPTNAHTYSVSAFQTGDSNTFDYSHNTGRFATLNVVGTPSPVAASATSTFFVKSNGASKVAFSFSGGGTLAGSPDTVDIYGVQTTANGCGTVNPSTGQSYNLSTPGTGTSSAPPIMAVSDGISQGYTTGTTITNPAANTNLISVENTVASTKTIYFDKLIITASAADTITFVGVNTAGVTCGTNNGGNLKIGNATASIALTQFSCTTNPTQIAGAGGIGTVVSVSANTVISIDLKGFVLPPGAITGLEILSGAVTGTVNTQIYWYEK